MKTKSIFFNILTECESGVVSMLHNLHHHIVVDAKIKDRVHHSRLWGNRASRRVWGQIGPKLTEINGS